MGLPLFVAPVESDLTTKASSKHGTASPMRTGIRRLQRPDSRDRRHGVRRSGVRIYGPSRNTIPSNWPPPGEDHFLPLFNNSPPDTSANRSLPDGAEVPSFPDLPPARESLRDITRNDDRRRERLEERMTSLFGRGWQDMAHTTSHRHQTTGSTMDYTPAERREMLARFGLPPPGGDEPFERAADPPAERPIERPDGDLGWWSVEPRPRARRTRLAVPLAGRLDRDPNSLLVYNAPNQAARQPPAGTPHNEPASLRARTHHPRVTHGGVSRRNLPQRRGLGVDGLGDRDRSLSPEVWDTLLSTLTPDPQPPSAGSSFASAVASQTSQSAGGSSSTPTTVPDVSAEPAADPHCESGCEHSDMEVDEAGEPERSRLSHNGEQRGLTDPRAATYNSDGAAETSARENWANTRNTSIFGVISQPSGYLPSLVDTNNVASQLPSPQILRQLRDSWVGAFSVGAGEGDGPTLSGAQVDEPAAPSQPTTGAGGEEEWSGMRRIVRSLARREDIPDEWWAEAGLSRTLP